MPNWTKEQQQAIDFEGTNILVSAGAGSGKTAVLTERVLRKLKEGTHINELLILTFTKAAASEMKERIRSSILEEPSLKKELDLIDASYITTFDSFALSIVTKYNTLLNISKNVSILEETLVNSLKKQYIEEIFESHYEKQDKKFTSFIGSFCTKDDRKIKEAVLKISRSLDLHPNKREYLQTYMDSHFKEEFLQKDMEKYLSFLKEKIQELKSLVSEFSLFVDGTYMEEVNTILTPLYEANTYEEMVSCKTLKFPPLKKGLGEEVKNKKKELTDSFKEFTNYLIFHNEEELKETVLLTKDSVEVLISLLLELDEKLFLYKQTKDAYEFSDIAMLATKVVKEYPDVREEMKHQFKEILIDEYQDTNDLQEEFISIIQNNNVYMVGDIKQSIYRFRNANPYLFQKKYQDYQLQNGGIKIDLNQNFRSRKEVLENINTLFDQFMDDEFGGSNYKQNGRMIFGNGGFLKFFHKKQNYNFEIYNYSYEKGNPYKKEEIEAFIIASDIKDKIINHYQILDKKTSSLRDIQYSDCAILLDRSTDFPLYKKVFEYFGIPLNVLKDETINTETDIALLKNILKMIQKIKENTLDEEFQYCYTSIARSFLFSKTDEEILKTFLKNDFSKTEIYQIAKEISSHYEYETPKQILNEIITSYHFYQKLITVGGIEGASVRFEYLEKMIENLTNLGYTIFDFTTYLEEMLKSGSDIRYSVHTTTSNASKIMTIHKSKGLEFPICYFAGLYKKFNLDDLKEQFFYDKEYGIITPYYQDGIGTLFYKDLIKNRSLKEEISERIRLFYVALTRAREKMIFVTNLEDKNNLSISVSVSNFTKMHYRSFQDLFLSVSHILKAHEKEIDLNNLSLSKDYLSSTSQNVLENSCAKPYTYKELEIQEKRKERETFSKHSTKLVTKEQLQNMEFGTKVHEVLEYFDFKNPDFSNLDSFLKEAIQKFLSLPILKDIQSSTIYHEYEFLDYETDSKGIIDLMIEWENQIIIIDYKLKNINEEAYQKQLKGYKKYIETLTHKPVKTYLYSILNYELEEVK